MHAPRRGVSLLLALTCWAWGCATEAPSASGDASIDDDALAASDAAAEWEDDARVVDLADAAPGDSGSTALDTDGGAAPADHDAGPPAACRTYTLRHLQASMQRTDTVAGRYMAADAAFDAGAHTISWTEVENIELVNRIQRRAGWSTYWPSGRPEVRAKNAVPISWRDDTFVLVRGNSWQASEGMAGVSPSRWVTRVWLRHVASGRIQSRVAHHSVSGVDGAGRDPVEWRRRMHALDIAEFGRVMRLDSVPVVGSADFNTTRLRALLGSDFRYDVPSSGGSHGTRLIDWVVRVPHRELRFVNARFISLAPSDHRGVRAAYEYTPPCAP